MKTNLACLIIFVVFIMISGCQNKSDINHKSELGNESSASTLISTDRLSAKEIPDSRERYNHGETNWILDIYCVGGFLGSLMNYRAINNRYPKDVKEFLDSGLLYVWPAWPPTGEPMKLVESIKSCKEDVGKIAYIYESDQYAYFQYTEFISNLGEYKIITIPSKKIEEMTLPNFEKEMKTSSIPLQEVKFHEIMNSLYSTLRNRGEYTSNNDSLRSIANGVKGNFFWIKENMAPDFLSANVDEPLFYEWGLAEIEGEYVRFLRMTLPRQQSNGEITPRQIVDISPLDSHKNYNTDEYWDLLENKVYYYSSKMLLEGTLNVPDEVLISKSEILGM